MNMKDNFSNHSKEYARFRPHYPGELFEYLFSLVQVKNTAWDCGTGNGQVAGVLANHFTNVFATDISQQQLDAAIQKPNIQYSVQSAEHVSFINNQFDLITVAQAIHWFRFDDFYAEVKRTLRPGGIFSVLGYGLIQTAKPLQEVIDHFYTKIIGSYWDGERHYIDEAYQTIPFPFEEITVPAFQMTYQWTFEQLIGYIGTWSAVKHYTKRKDESPLGLLQTNLKKIWGDDVTSPFTFPVFLRIGC